MHGQRDRQTDRDTEERQIERQIERQPPIPADRQVGEQAKNKQIALADIIALDTIQNPQTPRQRQRQQQRQRQRQNFEHRRVDEKAFYQSIVHKSVH